MFLSYARQCGYDGVRQNQVGALIFCWLISPLVLALDLSAITVTSGLNEPLSARIDILGAAKEKFELLTVGLADAEDFREAGIERQAVLSRLLFKIEENSNGDIHVDVTTVDPISEPSLKFVLEVNGESDWALREYEVFLRPTESATHSFPSVVVVQHELPDSSAAEPVLAEPPIGGRPHALHFNPYMLGGTVGPTIASDTLWSIATKVRSNYVTISVHQVMLALLRANPGAFSNGNINRLKRGVILELPKPGDIQKTPTIEALSEVKRQNDEWDTHRSLERPATRASEIVGGNGALTKSSPISLSEARLELVAPGAEDGGQAQAWLGEREELLREELDASIQQSDELTAKLTEAEEIIELLQRQVTIKDEELATLQHRLAEISVENDSIGDNNNERAVARDPHLLVSTSPLNNLFPDEFLSKFPGGAPALLVAVVLGFAGFCVIVVQFLERGGDFDGPSTDNQMANQATDEDFATRLSGDTEGSGMEDEVLIEDVADFELTLDSATEIDEVLVGSGSGLSVDGEDETRSGVDEYASLDDLAEHDVSFDDKYSELDNSSSGALDTKLDLAKAYIELGDEARARSILDEVNARGNDAQKMEANSLLEQLSS